MVAGTSIAASAETEAEIISVPGEVESASNKEVESGVVASAAETVSAEEANKAWELYTAQVCTVTLALSWFLKQMKILHNFLLLDHQLIIFCSKIYL